MTNSSIFPASTHRIVQGTIVDLAGVIRAKNVPAERLNTFAKNGVGAPKVWVVFNADNNFAENEIFNVTGDLRLRLDASQVRPLDEHILWGPTNLVEQNGDPIEYDVRNTLRNVVNKAAELGYTAKFGHEFEFLLLPEETALERNPDIFKTPWPGYGAVPFIGQEEFFSDLIAAAGAAGITLEQLHTEWGAIPVRGQHRPGGSGTRGGQCRAPEAPAQTRRGPSRPHRGALTETVRRSDR